MSHPNRNYFTAKHAEELFAAYGDVLIEDTRSMVDHIIKSNNTDILSGNNYFCALQYMQAMYERTHHSCVMLSGSSCFSFLATLHKPFTDMLKRIRQASGHVRIIAIDASNTCFHSIQNEYADCLSVILAKSSGEHLLDPFLVCDDSMVRVVSPHTPMSQNQNAHEIRADVYFHNRCQASVYLTRFDAMWTYLQSMDNSTT